MYNVPVYKEGYTYRNPSTLYVCVFHVPITSHILMRFGLVCVGWFRARIRMSHTLCNGMSHCHASRWMTARRACSSQQPNAPHRIHLLVLVPGTGTSIPSLYPYTPLPSIPYIEIIIHHTIIHHSFITTKQQISSSPASTHPETT